MAKVLVQRLLCDVHIAEDSEEVEGVTGIVGGEFGGPVEVWEIELCKTHADAPYTQVQAWAAEYGRDHRSAPAVIKPREPGKKSTSVYPTASNGRLQCPHCVETYTTPGRVDNHIRRVHPDHPLGTNRR